jgi:CubicO group peptidase (beta-lactamase class C family)
VNKLDTARLSATAYPSAAESDPAALGWMRGSPPPPERRVRFADMSHYRFPQTRWSFANFRQLVPSVCVDRGDGAVAALPHAERTDIDALTFLPTGSTEPMDWAQSLQANYTDAIMVLHEGRIVYERYFGVMNAQQPHMSMSVTKSFVGLLGAMLVAEGQLPESQAVGHYLPELLGSAFGDASVRQVLDMTTGVRYREDYEDPQSEVWQHLRAGGVFPRLPGQDGPEGFLDFLPTLQKEGEHGRAFAYKTVNTDVLGWLIQRVTGQPLERVLSERLWQPLGAEQDAYLLVDAAGTGFAGGGFNATLRDMARFGEMLRQDGAFNGRQIVPAAVVADIRRGADPAAFALAGYDTLSGWSYRNMWWVTHNPHGAYAARGVHGQAIYIDPAAQMVITRFGSHPMAANMHFDATSLPAFHALACHLMGC